MEVIEHPTSSNLTVKVLSNSIQLPTGSTISTYIPHNIKKLSKEAARRRKYNAFSYYRLKDGTILKGLFLNEHQFLHVSKFPFTTENLSIIDWKAINDMAPERLTINHGLLIGQANNDVVLKKISECIITEKTCEIDTINDNFERLPQGNLTRFEQLASLILASNSSQPVSIRITILEGGENSSIIDYDPFFVEQEYRSKFIKQ